VLKMYFPVSKLLMLQLIADVRNCSSHTCMGAIRIVSKGRAASFPVCREARIAAYRLTFMSCKSVCTDPGTYETGLSLPFQYPSNISFTATGTQLLKGHVAQSYQKTSI
jgi:hypothetical protein